MRMTEPAVLSPPSLACLQRVFSDALPEMSSLKMAAAGTSRLDCPGDALEPHPAAQHPSSVITALANAQSQCHMPLRPSTLVLVLVLACLPPGRAARRGKDERSALCQSARGRPRATTSGLRRARRGCAGNMGLMRCCRGTVRCRYGGMDGWRVPKHPIPPACTRFAGCMHVLLHRPARLSVLCIYHQNMRVRYTYFLLQSPRW